MGPRPTHCALPGCNVRLAGRRRNTRYCTPKHRVEDFRRRQALQNGSTHGDPEDALATVRAWLEGLPEPLEDRAWDALEMLDDLETEVSELAFELDDLDENAEVEGVDGGYTYVDADLRPRVGHTAPSVTNASDTQQDPPKRSGNVT